jgi:antitoxin component YwqK of YwqJK toxin-antitoxin module
VKTAEANYKKDIKDGKWYIWDDKGVKRYEMQYKDGAKTGTWYMWDENEKLIMEKTF